MLRSYSFLLYGIVFMAFCLPFKCLQQTTKQPVEQTASAPAQNPEPLSDSLPVFAMVSEATRIALVLPCGRCHQSTLDTHKPGAIAIFDLDAGDDWHSRLNAERLDGLESRAMRNSSISEEERGHIAEFIALKRILIQ